MSFKPNNKICSLAADVMIFKPTTFFIIVQTSFGLQLEIQLVPIMQVYIKADVRHKQTTNGKKNRLDAIDKMYVRFKFLIDFPQQYNQN